MSRLEFVTIFVDQLRDRIHSSTNQIPFHTFPSGKYTDPAWAGTALNLLHRCVLSEPGTAGLLYDMQFLFICLSIRSAANQPMWHVASVWAKMIASQSESIAFSLSYFVHKNE